MMLNDISNHLIILTDFLIIWFPETTTAYLGPGSGLTAIGSFLALLAGIVVTIIGFLWYPIKRLLGKSKLRKPDQITKKDE